MHIMKIRTGIVVLLASLPVVAFAETDAEMAQCTEMAQKFSSDPRAMAISELDTLKTCINGQQTALRSSLDQSRLQAGTGRARLRARLRDDF
jgi:hypothetical protein